MKEIKKVFSYAHQHKKKMYSAIALLTCSVALGIVSYYIVNKVIVQFLGNGSITLEYLLLMAGLLFVCLFLKTYTHFKGLGASHQLAYDTLMGMRKKLADKVMRMPMGSVIRRGSGGLKKNFVENIEDMELILAHAMPEGISNTLVMVFVTVILFIIDWRMALLALAVLPIGMAAVSLMMKSGIKGMKGYYAASKEMNENIIEYVSGMEVIKVFNQTTTSFQKFSSSVEKYKKYTLDWYRNSWTYVTIFSVILPSMLLFLLPFGTLFYVGGTLELGAFVLCMLLSVSMGVPIMRLVEFFPIFPQLKQKAQKIEDAFGEEEIADKGVAVQLENHAVSFEEVTFAYNDTAVLKDVSFTAKEGKVTALVGESGAGKSTLAKLLVRFWDIKKGAIKIGGVDIKDMGFGELMNTVSYVSQDIFLFNTTLMENIRMGQPEATEAQVVEMAKLAQCHDFIMEQEKGYDTMAGDAGDKLSGGQKQRISIARALLKAAPVVLLDEATSFTDPENEDKIQEALAGLIRGKTLIVIAHRLSTIVEADNIIVMDKGCISAQGKHDELLEQSAIYQRLWQANQESMDWDITVKEGKDRV